MPHHGERKDDALSKERLSNRFDVLIDGVLDVRRRRFTASHEIHSNNPKVGSQKRDEQIECHRRGRDSVDQEYDRPASLIDCDIENRNARREEDHGSIM